MEGNLDLEYSFGEQVAVTPRNYPLHFRNGEKQEHHYAIIGMAAGEKSYPLYAEAANEKGLCMAGLNFPGNACYRAPEAGKTNVASWEMIPYLLGSCASVDEAGNHFEKAVCYRRGICSADAGGAPALDAG